MLLKYRAQGPPLAMCVGSGGEQQLCLTPVPPLALLLPSRPCLLLPPHPDSAHMKPSGLVPPEGWDEFDSIARKWAR